jgi:hypothetical protein
MHRSSRSPIGHIFPGKPHPLIQAYLGHGVNAEENAKSEEIIMVFMFNG